jgi:hypothetical protein
MTSSNDKPMPFNIDIPIAFKQLADLLDSFIRARTSADGRRILEQHPELLGEDARFFLDGLIEHARAEGNAELLFVSYERRDLLQRCREVGVDAAFRELGR